MLAPGYLAILLLGTATRGFVLPRRYTRVSAHTRRILPLSSSHHELDETDWTVGDVHADLAKLRSAIDTSKEKFNKGILKQQNVLEYIAQSRRCVSTDLKRYFGKPTALSLIAFGCFRACQPVAHLFQTILTWHYWSAVTIFPLVAWVFLMVKSSLFSMTARSKSTVSRLFVNYPHITDSAFTPIETKIISFELWLSTVAVAGCVDRFYGLSSVTRILVRLSVLASLYQFPAMFYNPKENKTDSFLPRVLRILSTRWLVALEAGLAFATQPWLCGIVTYCAAGMGMLAVDRLQKQQQPSETLRKWLLIMRPIFAGGILGLWIRSWKPNWELIRLNLAIANRYLSLTDIPDVVFQWLNIDKQALRKSLIIGLSWLLPMLHLRAIKRILRLEYTHNYPLLEKYREKWLNPDKLKWRWHLHWRKPRRLAQVINESSRRLFYWLLLSGSVQEKIQRQFEAKADTTENDKFDILKLLEEDHAFGRIPFIDRDEWKNRAMKERARKHQLDYEQGAFEDPLGVAVQQTLGIGLGFEIDHMRPLEPGEQPTTRRLQARAAKSAIIRVQQLRNATAVTENLEGIDDPILRKEKKAELQRAADAEIKGICDELAELVPVDDDGRKRNVTMRDDTSRVDQYKREYHKTGDNEYTVIDLNQRDPESLVANELLRQYRKLPKNIGLDPTGALNDDDFVEALARQSNNRSSSSDDWPDLDQTLLV